MVKYNKILIIFCKFIPAKDLLLRLLEIEPDKRITADLALQHAFLCDKPEKISDFSEEEYNIQAEEGHALSLKEAGSKHE